MLCDEGVEDFVIGRVRCVTVKQEIFNSERFHGFSEFETIHFSTATSTQSSQVSNILLPAMKLSTILSSAIFAALSNGAALNKRQSVATCYGDQGPNLNDCKPVQYVSTVHICSHSIGDSLIALLGWTGTSTDQIEPSMCSNPVFPDDC
jgi:hypothetical protein